MPTLTRTRDGLTETTVVTQAQSFWYQGMGWTVTDATSVPPFLLDYVTQAQLQAALAALGTGGGGSGGWDAETFQDQLGPILTQQGWTYNDAANTFTPPANYDPAGAAAGEAFQDFLGPILTLAGWTYVDAANTFTPPAAGGSGVPADGSLTEAKYATGSVSARAIADGGVGNAELANSIITDAKIATGRALLGSTAASKYVQDIVGAMSAGWTYDGTSGTITLPTAGAGSSSAAVYEIPVASLKNYAAGATEAVRAAAYVWNGAVVCQALATHPGWVVQLPTQGGPWPLAAELDEFVGTYKNTAGTSVSFPPGQDYVLAGPAMLGHATLPSKGASATGHVDAAPVFSLTRKTTVPAFTPVNLRNTFILGPNTPNAGIVFTGMCTAWEMPAGRIVDVKGGDLIDLVSKNGFKWSSRAGYTIVYKGAYVPVAGIAITITGLSYTALSAAAGATLTSIERRTIIGQTSGTTALVQGDIAGAPQVVVNSQSGDFTAGENIRDVATGGQTTGALLGTYGLSSVIMAGTLDTVYDDTPTMRVTTPSAVDVSGLTVQAEDDPDAVIPDYNRSDAVYLAGCQNVYLDGLNIKSGYAAGLTLRSCWDAVGHVRVSNLPNHAIESAARESAYGYGVRLLGHTENFAIRITAKKGRHAQTTNGIGGTWNLNSRTGLATGSVDLCTNHWNHGPGGRNGVFTGEARAMIATCWDQHEGATGIVYLNPVGVEPFSAARSTTAPDGITLRGQGITVINPYFDGVRIGVNDQAGPLDSDGLLYTNDVVGGIIRNFQLGGIQQSEDSFSEAFARFRYRDVLLRGDPTVPSTVYKQFGILLRRGNTRTSGLILEAINDRYVRHTSYVDPTGAGSTATGHVFHDRITFDQADSVASRIFSDEDTFDTLDVVGARAYTNPGTTQKPFFWVTDDGTTTPFRYRDLIDSPLGTNKTRLGPITRTSGAAPAPVRILDLGETTGGAAAPTHSTAVAPTLTAQTAAGTTPTLVLASGSTDVSGEARVTMGTAPTSGAFVRVNYGTAFAADVFPTVTPGLNAHTRALGYTTHDATGFTVQFGNAPTAAAEYRFSWYIPGV